MGYLERRDKIGWASNYISVKEQQEIQQKAIDRLKKKEGFDFAKWVSPEENKIAVESIVKEMESDLTKIKDPIPIPVFSTIIKDSDGNLLFFEYPRKRMRINLMSGFMKIKASLFARAVSSVMIII